MNPLFYFYDQGISLHKHAAECCKQLSVKTYLRSTNTLVGVSRATWFVNSVVKDAGMPSAVITSTFRTPKEQASIMYRNAKKDYQAQVKMYRAAGDSVLKVYKDNSTKDKDDVIALMEQKIIDLLKINEKTSKHCVTPENYKKLNIIDIGVFSTKSVCGKEYNQTKFTNA